MKLSRIFYAAVPFFGLVLAKDNEPIPNSFVEKDILLASGQNLAFLSRPLWHFARSRGNPTCYPSSALFENGTQVPPAPLEFFPKAAFGCPDPGPRGEGPPFPTYYTVNYCGADEIRIQYSLFFKKDGFIKVVLSPCNGHAYDWERIIVVWKRNTTDNTWTRNKLLRSFHSGYKEQDWNDVQSTFNYDDINEIHGKNKDGPKIYVGWGKHAMFDDRNTGWNDCFSQGCNREFRSDDWWYLPRLGDLIHASKESAVGVAISSVDWGLATSPPPVVESRICTESGRRKGPECLSVCEQMEEEGNFGGRVDL